MGPDTGIVFTLRNISRSNCRIGGYLPVYSQGHLIPGGDNVVDAYPGNLRPGATAIFAIVDSYIQPQTPSMAPCPKWPVPAPAATLDGVTIGHIADIQNFCNRTFLTPVGVLAASSAPAKSTTSFDAMTTYLNAVIQGDCKLAEASVLPSESRPGDLCINAHKVGLHVDRWRLSTIKPRQSVGAVEYAVELHLIDPPIAGGGLKAGWEDWFLQFRRVNGDWVLVNGGTGP